MTHGYIIRGYYTYVQTCSWVCIKYNDLCNINYIYILNSLAHAIIITYNYFIYVYMTAI